jgi:hypothetical protein
LPLCNPDGARLPGPGKDILKKMSVNGVIMGHAQAPARQTFCKALRGQGKFKGVEIRLAAKIS